MVIFFPTVLEMDMDCADISDSEWEEDYNKGDTPLRNDLEEGEIDEEEIYVVAEFEGNRKKSVNLFSHLPKQDVDERIPFTTFANATRNVVAHVEKMSPLTRTISNERVVHVVNRDSNRRFNDSSKSRSRRCSSPVSNNIPRNSSFRPQMSGYSIRRQNILRSIHRRTRKNSHKRILFSHSQRTKMVPKKRDDSVSYEDLLAEYKDIKFQLRNLTREDEECENSNEGSYGDKENRIYVENDSSLPRNDEKHHENKQCRKPSRSSDSQPVVVLNPQSLAKEEDEDDEVDALRKIALASKLNSNKTLKTETTEVVQGTSAAAQDSPVKKILVDVEDDEDLLRAQLLSSLTLKQLDKVESNDQPQSLPEKVEPGDNSKVTTEVPANSVASAAYQFSPKLPLHEPLVINLKEDSDSEAENSSPSSHGLASLESIDHLLKSARTLSEASPKKDKSEVGVRDIPLPAYKVSEIDVNEYKRLKAEIANREQVKQIANPQQKVTIVKKLSLTLPDKLKLAEAKFLRSNELLINEESDYLKVNRQLTLNEKSLNVTELKILGLEQQIHSARKLELLQKQRVSELKNQKSTLEQKISSTKSNRMKFHRICLHVGKLILGNGYKIPDNATKLKKTLLKVLPPDKKLKSSLKKPKFRSILIKQGQSANKLANNLSIALQKSGLQKKAQELVSRLAELRKDTLKKSAIKSNTSKIDTQATDTQVLKRPRRQSITKKLKKQKITDADNSTHVSNKPSQQSPNAEIKVQKKLIIENTPKVFNSIFDFHHLFTDKIPKIVLRDERQSVVNYNGIIPEAFMPYRSSLISFRSYRYSPYFRTKLNQCLSWTTNNHGLKPTVTVCQYDLTGKCNDDKCKWQHSVNYILSPEDCLKNLIHSSSNIPNEILKTLDGFVSNLLSNQDKMTIDEMCVLVVGRMNELLNKIPPHFITFNESSNCQSENSSISNDYTFEMKNKEDREVINWKLSQELNLNGICDDPDSRYFELDNGLVDLNLPFDEQGWISLAKRKLYSVNSDPVSRLDKALDIMSRALELNSKSASLWSFYFSLYSKRQDCTDLTSLFCQALDLTPSYDIWWQYLQNTKSYEEKEKLCEKILFFCIESNVDDECKSHQLLEVSLYWIKLNVLTGHCERAVTIFEEILHRSQNKSINGLDLVLMHITSKDRCLIWLCYISLIVFHSLPAEIFSAENTSLGKVVDKSPFVLPWHQVKSWSVSVGSIIDLVMDALRNCVVKNKTTEYNGELCLPLYKNLIALKLSQQRKLSAITVGENLKKVANLDDAWIIQACVYYRIKNYDGLRKVLNSGLSGNTTSSILYSFAIMFEIKQNNLKNVADICQRFLSTVVEQPELNLKSDDEIESTFRQLLDYFQDDKFLINSNVICKNVSSSADVWLIFCMFLITRNKNVEAKEAFEAAILRLSNRQDLEMIWLYYLERCLSESISLSNLIDLFVRCFNSVPNKITLPGANGDATYAIYSYFNLVLYKYVSSLEDDAQILVYENFLTLIPNNSHLAIRLLSLYLNQGKYPTAWRLCCSQLEKTPHNLDLWKIVLQLANKSKSVSNIRNVYIRATDTLPYCQFLWKEFVEFEISKGEKMIAFELVKKCQLYGIVLNIGV